MLIPIVLISAVAVGGFLLSRRGRGPSVPPALAAGISRVTDRIATLQLAPQQSLDEIDATYRSLSADGGGPHYDAPRAAATRRYPRRPAVQTRTTLAGPRSSRSIPVIASLGRIAQPVIRLARPVRRRGPRAVRRTYRSSRVARASRVKTTIALKRRPTPSRSRGPFGISPPRRRATSAIRRRATSAIRRRATRTIRRPAVRIAPTRRGISPRRITPKRVYARRSIIRRPTPSRSRGPFGISPPRRRVIKSHGRSVRYA